MNKTQHIDSRKCRLYFTACKLIQLRNSNFQKINHKHQFNISLDELKSAFILEIQMPYTCIFSQNPS